MEYIAGETVSSLLGRSSSASSLTRLTISRLDSIHPRHLTSPRLTMNSTFIHCIEDIRRRRGEKRAAVCRQNIRRWMKGESRGFSFISPPPFSLSLFPRYPFRFHVSPLSSFFSKCSQSPSLGILFPETFPLLLRPCLSGRAAGIRHSSAL